MSAVIPPGWPGGRDWREIAAQHQLDSRLLTGQEVADLIPEVNGSWSGGIYTPSDGRGRALRRGARARPRGPSSRGRRRRRAARCARWRPKGGRVAAVHTERGRVGAQAVVLAGGAWSTFFAANLGLDLAAAHGPVDGGPHESGRRVRDAGRLLETALHPPPGRRRLHGRERRPRRALRRAALLPALHEVSRPAAGERPGPSRSASARRAASREAGRGSGAGPRTTPAPSKRRGC